MKDEGESTAALQNPSSSGRTKHHLLCVILIAGIALALTIVGMADPGAPRAASALSPSLSVPHEDVATTILTHTIFLPLVSNGVSPELAVDPQDRQASMDFYHQVYLASEGVNAEWTGNYATCYAGTTSDAFRAAVQLRINYFRAMAGVPATVQLSEEYDRKAQQAALMMSVNGQLSHNPPSTWQCYTDEGRQAAGSSNLALGAFGPSAITLYMTDPGGGNYFVGHRRWILYPQTQHMGTGDVPGSGTYWSSNALWVFDENMWGPRPETREEYVAWPPPGYVPYQLVFGRWSFSYPQADFSSSTVVMTSGGQNIPLTVQPVVNGYGENTLVWEPQLPLAADRTADTPYSVTVLHVGIAETYQDFAYQVTLFDPESAVREPFGSQEQHLGTPPALP